MSQSQTEGVWPDYECLVKLGIDIPISMFGSNSSSRFKKLLVFLDMHVIDICPSRVRIKAYCMDLVSKESYCSFVLTLSLIHNIIYIKLQMGDWFKINHVSMSCFLNNLGNNQMAFLDLNLEYIIVSHDWNAWSLPHYELRILKSLSLEPLGSDN